MAIQAPTGPGIRLMSPRELLDQDSNNNNMFRDYLQYQRRMPLPEPEEVPEDPELTRLKREMLDEELSRMITPARVLDRQYYIDALMGGGVPKVVPTPPPVSPLFGL
jgi:hypothetical protein|tara:strand:+ start:7271 stop:7591 length:321 start_codon:yes stop_codon:yes gene_type:complete